MIPGRRYCRTNAGWRTFSPGTGTCNWSPSGSIPSRSTTSSVRSLPAFYRRRTRLIRLLWHRQAPTQRPRSKPPTCLGDRAGRAWKEIHLPQTLLSTIRTNAWGMALSAESDLVPLNQVKGTDRNQRGIAPGQAWGSRPFLGWRAHHVFACEGRHTIFGPARRASNSNFSLPPAIPM